MGYRCGCVTEAVTRASQPGETMRGPEPRDAQTSRRRREGGRERGLRADRGKRDSFKEMKETQADGTLPRIG